jgi:hypothetical protein
VWIALLVLGGIFLGGVISFARTRTWPAVMVLCAGAVLAFSGAYSWMPR